jgi:hypothetical protein
MQTLKSLLSIARNRNARIRAGAFTALLLAGLLFGAHRARADRMNEEVFLYVSEGYVDVTSYLQVDQYGNTWVVGFDNEASFEIVIASNEGQVLDPYGNQIGFCELEP